MKAVKEIIDNIVEFLKDPQFQVEKIILFGSRAKKEHKEFSDIDIAIVTKQKLDIRTKRKIKDKIEELSGIYSVDLIFLEQTSNEFKEIIKKTGITIYEKNRNNTSTK